MPEDPDQPDDAAGTPPPVFVHVFLEDTVGSAGFDAVVGALVDKAVRETGGGAAAVGGCFPLAKSFALEAEPRVIRALQALESVKAVKDDAGDFVPPPASRRIVD